MHKPSGLLCALGVMNETENSMICEDRSFAKVTQERFCRIHVQRGDGGGSEDRYWNNQLAGENEVDYRQKAQRQCPNEP